MAQLILISKLKYDDSIYPRTQLDDRNVNAIARAYEAGITVEPIVVEKKKLVVIDGKHRVAAATKVGMDKIVAELKTYKDKATMLETAISLNIHGRPLSAYDKAYCTILADNLGLSEARLQIALHTTAEQVTQLKTAKRAIASNGSLMPLKRTMQHLSIKNTSKRFTKTQEIGHIKATGAAQLLYVNQVINLLEYKMVDKNNAALMTALKDLKKRLIAFV